MKTYKTRHQFYLPDDLSEKLEALSAKPGTSKTAIMTDALNAWFDRRAGHELDQRFGGRLDRLSHGQGRLENQVAIVAEALGVFVQHQLTLVADQPPFDREIGQLGVKRYQSFVELVGRRLAQPDSEMRLIRRGEGNGG